MIQHAQQDGAACRQRTDATLLRTVADKWLVMMMMIELDNGDPSLRYDLGQDQ